MGDGARCVPEMCALRVVEPLTQAQDAGVKHGVGRDAATPVPRLMRKGASDDRNFSSPMENGRDREALQGGARRGGTLPTGAAGPAGSAGARGGPVAARPAHAALAWEEQ